MKCNLVVKTNEITIRDYSLIEDEGLIHLASSQPGVKMEYEIDEEKPADRVVHMIVIKGETIEHLFKFIAFVDIAVFVID